MADHTSTCLAWNLKRLREARDLTQAELARQSGVPRPTIAHLETGSANPTLSVLLRVAEALQVAIAELVASPHVGALHRAATLPTRMRAGVRATQLLPEKLSGLAWERWELGAGGRLNAVAGPAGTRQYLTCEAGELELSVAGETWSLAQGDVVVLRADVAHTLSNCRRRRAIAYSLVTVAPVAG